MGAAGQPARPGRDRRLPTDPPNGEMFTPPVPAHADPASEPLLPDVRERSGPYACPRAREGRGNLSGYTPGFRNAVPTLHSRQAGRQRSLTWPQRSLTCFATTLKP